jgi:hypothetical protein
MGRLGDFLRRSWTAAGAAPLARMRTLPDARLLALRACRGAIKPRGGSGSRGGKGRYGRRDFLWHAGGEALLTYPERNVLGLSFDFAEDFLKAN